VLSVSLFEKMPISKALQHKDYTNAKMENPNQLILFNL
jgi:hypothetical protein